MKCEGKPELDWKYYRDELMSHQQKLMQHGQYQTQADVQKQVQDLLSAVVSNQIGSKSIAQKESTVAYLNKSGSGIDSSHGPKKIVPWRYENPDNLETLEHDGEDTWNWCPKHSKKCGMWHGYSLAKCKQWKQDTKEKQDASESSRKAHTASSSETSEQSSKPKNKSSKQKKAASDTRQVNLEVDRSVLSFLDKGGVAGFFNSFSHLISEDLVKAEIMGVAIIYAISLCLIITRCAGTNSYKDFCPSSLWQPTGTAD